MSDERLVEIEIKLAHQEQLLLELNDVVTRQHEQILKLEGLCGSLLDRVRSMSAAVPGDAAQDERPPHY